LFKRTAVALSLLALSSLAVAQQPAAWPWQPVQVWAVPANGQAVPFPTPFWLWVVPPGTKPAPVAPAVKTEPAPANPTVVVPPISEPTQSEAARVPAPLPVAVPAVTPAEMPLPVATPSPVPEVAKAAASVEQPADQVVVTPLTRVAPTSPVEIPDVPATVEVLPAPVKRAPLAKKIKKTATPAPARPVRKLCFKGGKLDVCP